MRIEGKLTDPGSTSRSDYSGHSVEVDTQVKLAGSDGHVRWNENTAATSDGLFVVDVDPKAEVVADLRFTIRDPAGHILLQTTRPADGGPHALEVAPSKPVVLDVDPDPFSLSLGPFSVRVRLLGVEPTATLQGRLVSIWGTPANVQGAAAPQRNILAADYTDANGTHRFDFPREAYKSLEAEVLGTTDGTQRTPISLNADGTPQSEVRLPVSFSSEPEKPDEDACECETQSDLPRTPVQSELAEGGNVFSTDLADGTCPSPAVANRTLEEYRYYSLIRTTDPYLKGVKPKNRRPLSDIAVSTLGEVAYGFNSMDAQLQPAPTMGGDTVALSSTPTNALASKVTLDGARQSSEAYLSTGLVSALAWRSTGAQDEVQKEIQARAANLSEDVLRYALTDPDGFTPVALMTAERYDTALRLKDELRLFHDASKGRELVAPNNMPQWDQADGTYQASTIAHGHVLEWRQVWRADGYSLGDLVYSLPLAPGQKRKVAVVDWDRGEAAFRRESRTFTEDFQADLSRNRTVTEVVNSTITESIDAGSSANTWAAGGGLGLGIPFSGGFFGLGVAGGGGGASSNAWQNSARNLSATSGQELSDRTSQAASAVRSQRASVVVGAQQNEGLAITSEVVANYNHCYAMTVEYFEVLQHFRVDQELADVRECLFIPLEMRPFNIMKALRWKDILSPSLRRRKWSRGFDAIERLVQGYQDSGYPPGRFADEPINELSGELRLELSITRPRDARTDEDIDDYLNSVWDFWDVLFGDPAKKAYDATIDDRDLADTIFHDEHAPRIARAFCEDLKVTLVVVDPVTGVESDETIDCDFTMVSGYRKGGLHLVSFRAKSVPPNVTRAMIRGVRFSSNIDSLSAGSQTLLRMVNVHYSTEYARHQLVPSRWVRNDILNGDDALVTTRSLTRSEERNPREEDQEARSGLLKHLNEFVEFYHQVIWWRMDPGRRFMLLDGFIAPNSGGRSLASVVENKLVSIVGNSLVMPVAPGYFLDPLIRASRETDGEVNLLEAYRPPMPFVPKRISLPTRGVHAEAILGECNACEIRDDTRFWDWASEPIPGNEVPEISEISTASRREEPADVTPTDLPNPVVAIQNAPAAPDPTSIGALAGLLGQENLFKDVTGLQANQENAIKAFEQSLKTANAFGKMAASGAKSSFANRNSERVMRKVDEAKSSGLLKDDDAKNVVERLFGVMNGGQTDTDAPLNADKVVDAALETVNAKAGKKKVSVSSSSGSTSQTVEAEYSTSQSQTSPAINTQVLGVVPLKQPSPLSCWAVALTMLESHQRQQSLPVETALLRGGQSYVDLYRADTGLPIDTVSAFHVDFGLKDVSFGAITAQTMSDALKQHGPLWVIADEDAGPGYSVHARVVTGVVGDGTPTGTRVIYNDPATGTQEDEILKSFCEKIAQLSDGLRAAFGGVSPTVLAL